MKFIDSLRKKAWRNVPNRQARKNAEFFARIAESLLDEGVIFEEAAETAYQMTLSTKQMPLESWAKSLRLLGDYWAENIRLNSWIEALKQR